MLRGRGRDTRTSIPGTPTLGLRSPTRAPVAKPEPDYEVVEFPSEQYVNAKLQPPPPPPPRPPTGHPTDTSCGLCGGGGARVRCSECGRRALCASCDDMYHRHPKRRNHQRQALPPLLIKDERPPLPPKGTPPVPPPRRHKVSGDRASASPKPPGTFDQRRAPTSMVHGVQNHLSQVSTLPHINFCAQRTQMAPQLPSQANSHLGSMPIQNTSPMQDANARGGFAPWGRPRASLPGYNIPPQNIPQQMEHWDAQENLHTQSWGRPLRRGTSVMELGAPAACSGYNHYPPNPWHYGSCANLEHTWGNQGPWSPSCCMPAGVPNNAHMLPHTNVHVPYTPQPYRRADSRAVSRAASRANSRAPSPALSMRSRTSRRTKHRTPSPTVPSSDADSESEPESYKQKEKETDETFMETAPPPPDATWQCEHCTFVNEPGVRVCAVCCRTPTVTPKIISTGAIKNGISKLTLGDSIPSPAQSEKRVDEYHRNANITKSTHPTKERVSTGCGPSPPKDVQKLNTNPLETPARERVKYDDRNDIAVGTSPPKEVRNNQTNPHSMPNNNTSPSSTQGRTHVLVEKGPTIKHSVCVGSSPPRSGPNSINRTANRDDVQKKSVGILSPRESDFRSESRISRTSVSNTGTSPPPQSISTQTYEVPNKWEKQSSTARSRPRRRFTNENRRERSHSRHSLSSDTRDSERSVRTGEGRWEWREPRDSSPGTAEWSENERKRTTSRLTRRASHLDLRRNRPSRKSSLYGSEAASPEPFSNVRANSLEALASANSMREAEKGLELARLMAEAERLGFSAAEVQAALAQNPVAPLAWLRERWPSLCAGVRAAAARLASGINVSELEARAALARHRGAMWPAVTECVERHRRQNEFGVGEEGKLRGRVWGSPIGADDEAAPPSFSTRAHRGRAEDSSDEYDVSTKNFEDDNWMYLPLDINTKNFHGNDQKQVFHQKSNIMFENSGDISEKLRVLLNMASEPSIEDTLIRGGVFNKNHRENLQNDAGKNKENILDFIQSEKDFIDAYNALTRLSPLPNIEIKNKNKELENLTDTIKITVSKKSNEPDENQLEKNEINEQNAVLTKSSPPTEEKQHQPIAINVEPITIQTSHINEQNTHIFQQNQKTINLTDLVDNTQKIIKQMKEEINYDINSTQESEESETNSNNSEVSADQESSYSETENDTEDLTSDEKEVISSSDKDLVINSTIKISKDTTSSEDNEQFEEAIDYIDAPSENMNSLKILDSIKNTLRSDLLITLNENKSKSTITGAEDINNNLFAVVNSFDEIYEQLNSNINLAESNQDTIKHSVEKTSNLNTLELKHNVKEIIQRSDIKLQAPIKQIITEIKYPVYKALAENVLEEKLVSHEKSNIIKLDKTVAPNIINTVSINKIKIKDSSVEINNDRESPKENAFLINQNEDDVDILESNEIDYSKITHDLQEFNKLHSSNDNIPSDSYVSKADDIKQSLIIKSNIPIPVKTNIVKKQNMDKSQKAASKLPVRRTSVKQYPAPAPPKTQFNNIQNGNVKQLQTKLFSNKSNKEHNDSIVIDEIMPSTSAASTKKSSAPQPPQAKQLSPPKIVSKEKEQYFRETCRTEDEWTESESDEDIKSFREKRDQTPTPEYQSPPPLTVRRISGQLIDLAKIRLPEGSPERQARMLLAEGASENWEQAQIAVELISRGTDAPTALLAALECLDLNSALTYLNQYCELCAAHFPEHEMVSMLRCSHRCCRECARHYFTVQITERSIVDCVCAYCKEPELEILDEDAWVDYFAHLDILLKTLIDIEVHELFQRKLRDRTLARDPNFRWCIECSSGFFVHPKQKKLRCPECRSITCASCRKPWCSNHDGISCDQYATWLEDNDPERSIAAVQQHLQENGLECPRCRFKYSLSRGGCMHFTCTQCKYEFCYGCGKPFTMGARCGLSEYCAKLGLHAHHPRNCLFYLRDKEPRDLQTLLQMNNVSYETEAPQGTTSRCPIQLQRETPTGLIDATCGSEVLPKHGGLCKMHYVEYLAGLARHIDPIPIMEVSELVAELRRRALSLPERGPWDTDPIYAGMCAEIVKEKIPLE